jgi:hypothetical protein
LLLCRDRKEVWLSFFFYPFNLENINSINKKFNKKNVCSKEKLYLNLNAIFRFKFDCDFKWKWILLTILFHLVCDGFRFALRCCNYFSLCNKAFQIYQERLVFMSFYRSFFQRLFQWNLKQFEIPP